MSDPNKRPSNVYSVENALEDMLKMHTETQQILQIIAKYLQDLGNRIIMLEQEIEELKACKKK